MTQTILSSSAYWRRMRAMCPPSAQTRRTVFSPFPTCRSRPGIRSIAIPGRTSCIIPSRAALSRSWTGRQARRSPVMRSLVLLRQRSTSPAPSPISSPNSSARSGPRRLRLLLGAITLPASAPCRRSIQRSVKIRIRPLPPPQASCVATMSSQRITPECTSTARFAEGSYLSSKRSCTSI